MVARPTPGAFTCCRVFHFQGTPPCTLGGASASPFATPGCSFTRSVAGSVDGSAMSYVITSQPEGLKVRFFLCIDPDGRSVWNDKPTNNGLVFASVEAAERWAEKVGLDDGWSVSLMTKVTH